MRVDACKVHSVVKGLHTSACLAQQASGRRFCEREMPSTILVLLVLGMKWPGLTAHALQQFPSDEDYAQAA